MAYYLRGTKRNNGDIYYPVYDSYYDVDEKKNKNRCIKPVGLLSSLKKEGESDEECYFRLKQEVKAMEEERKRKNAEQIDDKDYILNFGHLLPLFVVRSLNVSKKIDLFAMYEDGFDFSPADLLFTLAYTKIFPLHSEEETNPAMYGVSTFTDDQMLGGLEFLGSCYQEIMEAMNDSLGHIHKRKRKRCFFNYSDFYLKKSFNIES